MHLNFEIESAKMYAFISYVINVPFEISLGGLSPLFSVINMVGLGSNLYAFHYLFVCSLYGIIPIFLKDTRRLHYLSHQSEYYSAVKVPLISIIPTLKS